MVVRSIGNSLMVILPDLVGKKITNWFDLVRPLISFKFQTVSSYLCNTSIDGRSHSYKVNHRRGYAGESARVYTHEKAFYFISMYMMVRKLAGLKLFFFFHLSMVNVILMIRNVCETKEKPGGKVIYMGGTYKRRMAPHTHTPSLCT